MFEPQGHLFSVSGRNRQIKDQTSGERQNKADEMQPPPASPRAWQTAHLRKSRMLFRNQHEKSMQPLGISLSFVN
jgi:hypothetical protein